MSRAWKIQGAVLRAVQLTVFALVFAVLFHALSGPRVDGGSGQLVAAILGALFGVMLYVLNRQRDQ